MADPLASLDASLADSPAALRERIYPLEQIRPRGALSVFVTAASVALALFTLYLAFTITIGEVRMRAGHLFVVVPLIFLLYPLLKRDDDTQPGAVDYLLALAAAAAFAWAFYSADRWLARFVGFHPVGTLDLTMGIIAIVTVFEATRRTVGATIVVLNLVFMAYALTGPVWPGVFEHRGVAFHRLIEMLYMDTEGMFNFIMGIMATFLFTFLMFGTFLRVTGGDRIFTDFALALAGHRAGGPAKVAVISSAFLGMLSGSSISNVLTTGALTIPMMKQTGFKPHEAAAIETTASLGGGLMPPLMGTGVFIMASFTGVPLLTILAYSFVPAVLYFASIYVYVDVKAKKQGLMGLDRAALPTVGAVLRRGWHMALPIIVLIGLLLFHFTPFLASAACVVMILFTSFLRAESRITPGRLVVALEGSTRIAITLSALLCSAAIIYTVSVETGLFVKLSSVILSLSQGSALIAIVLIGLMSYVLGMGLPVTASYVIIAALGAPALGDLGVPVLAAHLIIFWFAQDSTITPPICMTAFAGARIAGAAPMRTGWECVMIAKALYVIPFSFAFGGLLSSSMLELGFTTLCLFAFFALMPRVFEGYLLHALTAWERGMIAIPALAWLWGAVGPIAERLPVALGALVLTAAAVALVRRRHQAIVPA
ncbi:TRAP transporter permease [Elioraea sp.]|uniref:TRAP transporter permease n=1 Tax=Elioraea sp. TaxID=2185103 RepID=UPI003F720EB5